MKRKNQKRTRFVTLSAVIAALYVVLTLLANAIGLANQTIQLRFSEALCALAFFTPAAIPGLTIGCFLSNLIIQAPPLDLIFGTLATFIGVVGGYLLRKNKWLVTLPTVISNTVIIPFVIVYGYMGTPDPSLLLINAAFVFLGEFVSATLLGTGLLRVLKRYNFKFN